MNEIWQNIIDHAGENFRKKRGGEFQYEVLNDRIRIIGNVDYRNITLQNFLSAYQYGHVDGPGVYRQVNDPIYGPSYVWSLLHDERINVW